jgi:homoserine dehydrogenase
MQRPVIVLKFGSSVLQSPSDLSSAVHEIYRWRRQRYSVLAVVSAFAGETDRLLYSVEPYANTGNPAIARIVATGEETATALLALELDKFGVPATVLDASQIEFRAMGDPCDAEPVSCSIEPIQRAFAAGQVVVVPGYSARDAYNNVLLLGRGGSDLSAIFLADQLKARCRVVKDVAGIFTGDPRREAIPQCYHEISWPEARRIAGRIVQSKAIAYAESASLRFEVSSPSSDFATQVGTKHVSFRERTTEGGPIRVGLLGLGTVGLGVFRELWKRPDLFEVKGIAVRNRGKHLAHAPHHLLTGDCWKVIEDADLVIEAIGGIHPALDLVSTALAAGKHVVTANKQLLATAGSRFEEHRKGGALRYSAAVGGALPVLETVQQIAKQHTITEVSGVVNGTCNFVLDRIADGSTFDDAVREAQRAGFAEADPTMDIDGTDTACKLQLIAEDAFGVSLKLDEIERQGIIGIDAEWVRQVAASGSRVRLVGSVRKNGDEIVAAVAPTVVDGASAAGCIREEQNAVTVKAIDHEFTIFGRGAGRWPTTVSVIGDIFEIARSRATEQPSSQIAVGGAV